MTLSELLNEEWYTADDIEDLWLEIKKVVHDDKDREKIMTVFQSIRADEKWDAEDLDDLYKGIKQVVKKKKLRKKILKLIQKA